MSNTESQNIETEYNRTAESQEETSEACAGARRSSLRMGLEHPFPAGNGFTSHGTFGSVPKDVSFLQLGPGVRECTDRASYH